MQPRQQSHYIDNPRSEVAPFVPQWAQSVLDVGCSRGGFGRTLRGILGENARIVGVEAVPLQAQIAREGHGFNEVIEGYFPDALATRYAEFDLISFNDVLEHLVDPWEVLRHTAKYLNARGVVLATIPNVQHASVVTGLLRGDWTYTESGILDRTHLRFFTKKSMVGMFTESGYVVDLCQGVNAIGAGSRDSGNPLRRAAGHLASMALRDAQFLQFVVVARPALSTCGGERRNH